MVETVSARRTQTRERLMDAAVQAFAEKGVGGSSVEEICDAAGFTRGAFYSNFDSKDALCLAVLERLASVDLAATHEAIASLTTLPGAHSLDDLAARGVGVFIGSQRGDRASVLVAVELRLYAVRQESLRADYVAFSDRISAEFLTLIEQGASALGYRLVLPAAQALAVLQGVFEQSTLTDLLRGRPQGTPGREELLAGVLKSMLAPA